MTQETGFQSFRLSEDSSPNDPWPAKDQVYEITLAVAQDRRTLVVDASPEVLACLEASGEGAFWEIGGAPEDSGVYRVGVRYCFDIHQTPDGPEAESWLEAIWHRKLTVQDTESSK